MNRKAPFIWPLGKRVEPDEMNTSYGPRIDADRWDFHDGIDLPAPPGTLVHAARDGEVHRAGPADKTENGQGFGSTHVLLKVEDPEDGRDDLFLVHLHLDAIAEGIVPGARVKQGDVIGAVGQEDATYPHLHFEFRKGAPRQDNSVHPLRYLPYANTTTFSEPRLDRCNFYRDNGDKRAVRLRFEAANRLEGDLQGVDLELNGDGVAPRRLRVDFEDRTTIASDKGDEHAFNADGVAVEGYQKSNLKGDGLIDLRYGVIVQDITPEFTTVKLGVVEAQSARSRGVELPLPTLEAGQRPLSTRPRFEVGEAFPPRGAEVRLSSGNVCRPDEAAALTGSRGLLCRDIQSAKETLVRAGLRFALPVDRSPVRPMSWRLRADIRPAELQMDAGLAIHPLAFLAGDDLVAAASLRKISGGELRVGVAIRSLDGLVGERIDVGGNRASTGSPARWELELLRVGTRQTTAVVRLNNEVVARIDGDTVRIEPDTGFVGIAHRHGGLGITLHLDELLLTEEPR